NGTSTNGCATTEGISPASRTGPTGSGPRSGLPRTADRAGTKRGPSPILDSSWATRPPWGRRMLACAAHLSGHHSPSTKGAEKSRKPTAQEDRPSSLLGSSWFEEDYLSQLVVE